MTIPMLGGPLVDTQVKGIPRVLVLLRHGESEWNKENRFCGWTDVDLTRQGWAEGQKAGRGMSAHGLSFDMGFTSVLTRAIRTLWITLDEMDLMWIPVHRDWRLNERHYGALQGLNKAETARKYGEAQVHSWRRSYDVRPPALEPGDARHPSRDPSYRQLRPEQLPATESLKDTVARFLPCWHDLIAPEVQRGQRVLISGHGNSLRALVKVLDHISDEAIADLNIPTGIPLVYQLDAKLQPIRHYYLDDAAEVPASMGPAPVNRYGIRLVREGSE